MKAEKTEASLRPKGEGITSNGVKKTIWFHEDEAEALRVMAFKSRRSESSIIREAVRSFLRMED
jgi:hypothetical protein